MSEVTNLSTSTAGSLNATDFKKLGRNFGIAVAGAVLSTFVFFIPQTEELVKSYLLDKGLVYLVPFIPVFWNTVIDFVYRWTRDNGIQITDKNGNIINQSTNGDSNESDK